MTERGERLDISKGAGVPAKFNDEEKKLLRGLAEGLEQFRRMRGNIPVHQVIMLLRLALNEGKSQKFYSEDWDMPTSTVSRGMLDLGKRNRKGEEGLLLVDERVAAHSLREHEAYLSPKGRTTLQRVIKKIMG